MSASRTAIALLIVVSASASTREATAGEVPAIVSQIVQQSCVGCHGADHTLDLRVLPAVDDIAAWKQIRRLVAEQRMPPPQKTGPRISARFPLDPALRRAFVEGVEALLGARLDPPSVAPRQLVHAAWLRVARSFASALPDAQFERIVSHVFDVAMPDEGWLAGQSPRSRPPFYLVMLAQASHDLCAALADSTRGTQRALQIPLARAGHLAPRSRSRAITTLWTRLYGVAPSAEELAAHAKLLEELEAELQGPRQAWVAYCAAQLSGPRLIYLPALAATSSPAVTGAP